MKHSSLVILTAAFLCFFSGCKAGTDSSSPKETLDKDVSYAMGMDVGSSLKMQDFYPNEEEFMRGMRDILTDTEPRLTFDQAYQILNEAFTSMAEKRDVETKQAENVFLAENSKKPGVNITGSGLQYEVIQEGNGPKPIATDTVRVHYEGALTDGTVFDSSYSRGEPAEFALSQVIPGWTEGLQLMNTGSTYRLFIPSELGYGSYGAGNQIPPYSTLVFEVELLDIVH